MRKGLPTSQGELCKVFIIQLTLSIHSEDLVYEEHDIYWRICPRPNSRQQGKMCGPESAIMM
uniref:Uncharacterized protein n=1 Tax=Arundo donax TaxID=35708 RepID=A0A0A8Z4Q5_ARUDO